MTNKQISNCQLILDLFKEQGDTVVYIPSILASIDHHPIKLNEARYTIHFLIGMGFLNATDGVNKERLILTDLAWSFEKFEDYLGKMKRREELEEALLKSSISANHSTKYVNNLFIITIVLAAFSSIASLGTLGFEIYKYLK